MRIDYNFYLIPHLHETFTTKTEEQKAVTSNRLKKLSGRGHAPRSPAEFPCKVSGR